MKEDRDFRKYEETTFASERKIKDVFFPKSTHELSDMVKSANKEQQEIYVSSTGLNYGYGNTVPLSDNSILINLVKLNKILDYDSTHGFVILGPGVTFDNLFHFLKENGDEWIIAGTGGPIDSSLIGNLAERGIGKGPTGNRSDYVCNLEVVLPTGEIVHTNMGRFENCKVKNLTRWGFGPQLDGLFIQSSLGIITKATFWLTPKPKYFCSFIFLIKSAEQLFLVINELRELKQKDIIRSNFALFNDYRALTLKGTFPWELEQPSTSLPRKILQEEIKKLFGHNALWIGEGALFCHSKAQLRAEKAIIKKTLRPHCKHSLFLDSFKSKIAKFLSDSLRKTEISKLIDNFYYKSGYLGTPIPLTLSSCYWRKKVRPTKIDPIKDGCGLIWLGPMLPFNGADVEAATKITETIIFKYGLEPAITLQALTSRQIDMIISISYDRMIPGQDEVAMKCHDELLEKLIESGYYPYRLGAQSMNKVPKDIELMNKKLKSLFDPEHILGKGRYER